MASYSNPYYSSSYDEFKNRQQKQKSGQDFVNEAGGYQQPRIPTTSNPQTAQQQPIGSNVDYSSTMGSVAGLASGVTSQLYQPKGDRGFEIDPYAGYTGSFQGLSSGGAIGAIAGGIGGEAGGFIKSGKAIDKYNASNELGGIQYDANGKPIYNAQGVLATQDAIKELKDAEKSATSWWQGGSAGGVLGVDTTTLFGELNGYKRKARRKRAKAIKALNTSQNNYNTKEAQYQQQVNTAEEYNKRLNNQDRINNLYSIPTQYQQMF